MRPQTTYRDGFQSTYTAVIAYIDTRQVLHRIGELQRVELTYLFTCKDIKGYRGGYLPVGRSHRYNHLRQIEAVGYCLRNNNVFCGQGHNHKQKYFLYEYLHQYRMYIPAKLNEKETRKN